MSPFRRLLVHVTDNDLDEALVRFAARLAAQHDAGLQALHAVEPFSLGAYLSPEAAMTAAEVNQQLVRERSARARERVHRASQAAGRAVDFRVPGGDPLQALMAHTRTSDLALVIAPGARDDDALTPGFASQLVVGTGCPVMFVPKAALEAACGTRILVAWSDTRESARALRDALPLLRRAKAVEVLRFGLERAERPDGAEPMDAVAGYLDAHGVKAQFAARALRDLPFAERMLVPNAVDASIAELLLSHAADTSADLIVMGGYGHPRAYEFVLGGVTRTMLASMTVPVLMSH
ncbi:universal stress protein [Methylibium petroleiphilum]|jgi:nucleotide-binding universal stress UspA family protein|uniref:universal stress protein n=1 Tax=Methylibium petroleiphilum TaxID=105560 RepID=UPI001AD43AEC|nr:universal stress protein [Methylibium petroleiphilum]MBN9203690.1 universal stress protein [Methylibium petroleiphilum]